ncbi:hypothetical protein CBR_g8101 [Chara braunii]|uniref:Uncharacterized protein n=1 Tax=Chara braunii TaxID=69332 RepID=A0A388KL78_CHABU|nr:hypothetical protein CBR_g8101 [Chara braunii]|eukprot:GBG70801.1 hypothetical protein CBR_g8101 [Chara braunii]
MPRSQSRVFEDGGEDENRKAQKKCCVYKYIRVGQSLSERFHGNRMLKCVFCGHEFQGNQFVAARHFRQGKGCPEVTDEALVDIHYNSEYKMSDKFLERIQRFEELHGADTAEAATSAGKRKEREEGDRPTAAAATQKRMRQNTITESFSSKWQMELKKKWLRFVYSQRLAFNVFRSEPWLDVVRHFRDLSGPVKVLWPSENEIADIETIVHTTDDVGADLAEVRAPFYITGATIMSDGRKSRDARPIVNFLVGGSRGVMLVRTMNREGERDRAPDVLACWIKVFDDFDPKWVNAICTDSASVLDRGGLHMSWVVEWTQDLARQVAEEVFALPTDLAHYIVQRVQARCTHMLEPAHAAAHLLSPSRRDLRYFEGVVSDYDASEGGGDLHLVADRVQCGEPRLRDRMCTLQVIALRVMYMWTCSSPAERNWAVHEGVQTKKRNRLEFEKVAKLVEILANVRLLSHQRAGRGFALPWTLDESLLDVEGGIGIRPSWKGTDESRTREEVEAQRRSWQRNPCGSRAPPGDVGDVFGNQAATHPYPRDDSDSEGHEDEDEPAGPAIATPAADQRDEWSNPKDVRRRSGGDDLFVRVDLEEESGGRHGSPLERSRPTSSAPLPAERETDPGSAPSRGAESGIGHRPLGRSGTASSTALTTSTEQPHRQPAGADRLQKLVRGPRQRLEDRLEGGPMPVQGDDGDRQGLVGGDGGALAGGGGGVEVDAAVEGIQMGGGCGFSEFGDMGMPPGESVGLARGESEFRGDISVGMQDLLGQISSVDPSSFSPTMRTEVMLGAEGDEDRTPPGETSAERLDRLDSRRAYLLAQRDPRTQELARLAAEERQRQLGTFTPASQGTHDSGLSPTEEPRLEPAQPPAAQLRPEETLQEVAGVPLPAGSVEGVVHMSPGLEDIQTGQSVGVDDIRPLPQAEGIAPATGGDGAVAGAVGVGGSGVSSAADPMSTSGGGDPTQVDRPRSGGVAEGLPSGGSVAAASGGAAGDLPSGGSVAAPYGGAAGPSSPLSAAPREGGSLTPRSVARRRRDTTQRARELLDTILFGRTDRPWSETRRVTTASVGRQPGLRGVSTSTRRRDVVAAGFGGRGGGSGGSAGDGDGRCEGVGGATTSAVDPPRTYGLREASIILEEPDVVTRLRQARHVPLD